MDFNLKGVKIGLRSNILDKNKFFTQDSNTPPGMQIKKESLEI